nr:uncharacterized protein LOC109405415 [Aedes albopictus]
MAILEKQASEPQPENPKKIRIDGEASAKQSSEPQPGTSKGFGEETFVKPMDLSQTYKASIIAVQLSEASTWSNSVQRPTNPSEVKLLEDNDTTDDESPDEATVHEEQVADENRFQEFEDQAGRDSDDLHNECNEKIVSLENQISKLSEEIITLKDHKARFEKQNWMLQVKIVQDNDKRTLFTVSTEKDGYPSPEWLIKASTVANDSDYLFVKE